MPAVEQIAGPRGPGYWASIDPDDYRPVAEALKEEFQRPESAHAIHWCHSGPDHVPPNIPNTGFGVHCLKDCLLFLLQGQIFIEGQGRFIEPGYAYAVKDEKMIRLGGNTTVFVMEEGEMRGICAQKLKEAWEEEEKLEEAREKRENRPWNKVLNRVRPEKPEQECPVQ
ncbi:hypothetical protein QBC37DRAFT_352148 [Rhypophila decipiens]|uniref:Uncharacterized protein n=1 Tax=Rhypophila decipiens TaxID=261697 RepID=A0AAN6XYD7_9PEZI|nr:hypothetical protein QBC37DRAFT_352148 [Rhypophila decipiens]